MSEVTSPVILDSTGIEIAEAIRGLTRRRVEIATLDGTDLAVGTVIEAVGVPTYVADPSAYAGYGISESGWYIFARIYAGGRIKVTAATQVTGAAGCIKNIGEDHVDVAVRFGVAAESVKVTVNWGSYVDTFVFKATDLAVRNLDYRTTFYVYDLDEFCSWEYQLTADATFAEGKKYYLKDGEDYIAAEVTAGETVPALYYEDSYALTADETFVEGKTYYTEEYGAYTEATVTPGEAVPEGQYYEHSYALSEDAAFAEGKSYYTKSGDTYSAAEVTAGEALPPKYYNHSKLILGGMTRNITYKLDETVDCPMEVILPEIEDDTHGCWFEFQLRHSGSFSTTLTPPEGVKIATEHTQAESAGFNLIDLHYMKIDGVSMWRFMNTHSSIPT